MSFLKKIFPYFLLILSLIYVYTLENRLYNISVERNALEHQIVELRRLNLSFYYTIEKIKDTQSATVGLVYRAIETIKSTGLLDKHYKSVIVAGKYKEEIK